jgi:hypothetical protein
MLTVNLAKFRFSLAPFLLPIQIYLAPGLSVPDSQLLSASVTRPYEERPTSQVNSNCKENEQKECDHHRGSREERLER